MGYLIIIGIGLFFLLRFLNRFKVPKVGSVALVTGGVKCGKTNLAVALALKEYKKRCRSTKVKNFFLRIRKKREIPLPLLYSNIPLSVPYVEVTEDLLLRKKRFVYNSVILISEVSLVADSTLIRDMDLNDRLLMFNKLIGHETKGGVLIYDTQCIGDCHFSVKRCLSNYFYVHHITKWIPFFVVLHIRELMYSDDNSTINVFNSDVEDCSNKLVLLSKSVWKKYDRYCYSAITDDLPVENKVIKKTKSLKANKIVSFRERRIL